MKFGMVGNPARLIFFGQNLQRIALTTAGCADCSSQITNGTGIVIAIGYGNMDSYVPTLA